VTVRELGVRGVAGTLVAACGLAYAAAYAPIAAVAGVAAIVLVIWIVTRAEMLLLVLVAAVPWEGMLEFPSPTVSVLKLLGAALVLAYLFRAVTRGDTLRFSPILLAGFAFAVFIALSLIGSEDPTAGVGKTLRYAFFLIFLFLVSQLVQSTEGAYRLLRVLVLSTTAAALYGLFGFLSGNLERAAGPLQDANDFGYLIATVLPLAALLLMEDTRLRWTWIGSVAILLAATLATLSRGALVGVGALAVWAIASRRVGAGGLLATGLVVVTVATLALTLWAPVINERVERKQRIGEENVQSRIAFWEAAGRMSLEEPLLGIGPDRFGDEADRYLRNNPLSIPDPVVHNTYLELLVENGIFALSAFLVMLWTGWRALSRAETEARDMGERRAVRLAAAVKGSLVIAVVAGLFLSEQLTLPFWLICGLAASGAFAVAPARASAPAATRPAIALR
jgi:O-antigen ligase